MLEQWSESRCSEICIRNCDVLVSAVLLVSFNMNIDKMKKLDVINVHLAYVIVVNVNNKEFKTCRDREA